MSKRLKLFFIFTIILALWMSISHAETTNLYNDVINENTSTNSLSEETNTTTDETNTSFDDDDDLDLPDTTNNVSNTATSSGTSAINSNTRVNTLSSIPEANLGLNNILCIILIAIGILIVLLAIAILIRLKK